MKPGDTIKLPNNIEAFGLIAGQEVEIIETEREIKGEPFVVVRSHTKEGGYIGRDFGVRVSDLRASS